MNQFFCVLGVFETVCDSFKVKNCHLGDELQMEDTVSKQVLPRRFTPCTR
jgi:hypothetical protein